MRSKIRIVAPRRERPNSPNLFHARFLRFLWRYPPALAGLVVVAVVIPAGNVPWLDGVPISGIPELLTIGLCVAWSTIPYKGITGGRRLSLIISILTLSAIVLKIFLLFTPPVGFQACYKVLTPAVSATVLQNLFHSRVNGPSLNADCEKSYDAPFASDYTRYDSVINFGRVVQQETKQNGLQESNWNLSAVNSLNYAFDAKYTNSTVNRSRLAFSVLWNATLDPEVGRVIRYRGEGSATIGGVTFDLPASYERVNTIPLPPTASGKMSLYYKWEPVTATYDLASQETYGEIHFETSAGSLVEPKPPALWTTILALLAMLALSGVVLLQLFGASRYLFSSELKTSSKANYWILPLSLSIFATIVIPIWRLRGLSLHSILPACFLILLLITSVLLGRRKTLFLSVLLIPPLSIIYSFKWISDFSSIQYRTAMDDFIVFESYAREIFAQGNLRGGEDVFIYSPAIRYLLYVQHVLLGDSDKGIFVLSIMGLMGATWFAIDSMLVSRITLPDRALPVRGFAVALSIACVVLIGLLYGSSEMMLGGAGLLSEYPTWVLLTFAFPLVFFWKSKKSAVIASSLLALSLTFRGNQLPGIAVMMLFLVYVQALPSIKNRNHRGAIKALCWVVIPFIAIASLPGLHNIYYGGRLVLLQTSYASSYFFTPMQMFDIVSNPSAWNAFMFQLGGVLAIDPQMNAGVNGSFITTVRLIQLEIIVTIFLGIAHLFKNYWRATLLTAVPLAFLGTHLFVQVNTYYPRHIVAGYAMGSLTLLALAGVVIDHGRWTIRRDQTQFSHQGLLTPRRLSVSRSHTSSSDDLGNAEGLQT